jgi:hypothetical protein
VVPYPNLVCDSLTRTAAQPPQLSDVASATCTPVADALPCLDAARSRAVHC